MLPANVRTAPEPPTPLAHLVMLGRKVEDLASLAANLDGRVDDLFGPSLVAVAERFVEDNWQLPLPFLHLQKGETHGKQKLESRPAGELVERQDAGAGRLDRAKRRLPLTRSSDVQPITAMRDPAEQVSRRSNTAGCCSSRCSSSSRSHNRLPAIASQSASRWAASSPAAFSCPASASSKSLVCLAVWTSVWIAMIRWCSSAARPARSRHSASSAATPPAPSFSYGVTSCRSRAVSSTSRRPLQRLE